MTITPETEGSAVGGRHGVGFTWLREHASLSSVRTASLSAKSLGSGRRDRLVAAIGKRIGQSSGHVFYTVVVDLVAEKADEPIAQIEFELVAAYQTGDERPDLTFRELIEFGERRALADIRPYALELAQSLAARIGLSGTYVARHFPSLDEMTSRRREPADGRIGEDEA